MPRAHPTFPTTVSRQVSLIAYIGFALTGIVTTMLGPLLPALKVRWGLTDAQAGYLFAAQFAASVVSTMMLPAIKGKPSSTPPFATATTQVEF